MHLVTPGRTRRPSVLRPWHAVLLVVVIATGTAAYVGTRSHTVTGSGATRRPATGPRPLRPAPPLVAAVMLAEPYRHIRPADADGSPPPIAPAELWPAQ